VGSHAAHTCPSIGSAALQGQRLVHRAVKRSLATLTIVALFAGATATAATAVGAITPTLRAQVDAIGGRFLSAQAQARALDAELRALDQRLARTQRRKAALLPVARERAVQLYQSSAESFLVLFDASSAMESARRAELIARASDHTQALIDEYANAAATLESQRTQVARARAKQAAVVAALATQQAALEQALARAQQAYRDQLAAQARARANQTAQSSTPRSTTPLQAPAAGPPRLAPVPVAPPAPPQSGQNPHHDDPFLVCTRTRESAGDYTAVNLGGYYGAYQFGQPTWDLTANHAGSPQLIGVRPDQASPWDQDQLAWVLHQWRGNAPWGGLC
jgi:uncharacterized membrane-anchored protein YhcB (DUF1043 family)